MSIKNFALKLIELFTSKLNSEGIKEDLFSVKKNIAKMSEDESLSIEDRENAKTALKYLQEKTEN